MGSTNITFGILKPINECSYTGLEKVKFEMDVVLGDLDLRVTHLEDNFGKDRFIVEDRVLKVVSPNNAVIAAIVFDTELVVDAKETHPDYRRRGIQNELWKFAAMMLRSKGEIKHSENLTELGRLSIKGLR